MPKVEGVAPKDRVILHADLNNFFASVEQVLSPELRGKAIAVCGDVQKRSGIVLAKSEAAKRFGIKTGDQIWQAKQKCKDLVIVAPHYDQYEKYSNAVQQIYYRFTDRVESFGMDECWLDVTACGRLFGTGPEIAERIRQTVRAETGLTISVGVSWNKTFAKLASDMKKPDAMTIITRENYSRVVYPLPASDMLFVGRKTAKLLERLNIKTIGDVAAFDAGLLASFLGINAGKLIRAARGECAEIVRPFLYKDDVKSVGNGRTSPKDLVTIREVRDHIWPLCEKLTERMRRKFVKGTTITVSLRFSDLTWTREQTTITRATNSSKTVFEVAMEIVAHLVPEPFLKNIRAARVAVSNLVSASTEQLDFLDGDTELHRDKISQLKDLISK